MRRGKARSLPDKSFLTNNRSLAAGKWEGEKLAAYLIKASSLTVKTSQLESVKRKSSQLAWQMLPQVYRGAQGYNPLAHQKLIRKRTLIEIPFFCSLNLKKKSWSWILCHAISKTDHTRSVQKFHSITFYNSEMVTLTLYYIALFFVALIWKRNVGIESYVMQFTKLITRGRSDKFIA